MMRKVKLTTRHGLHWTLDKGVCVALQALTHKARATFDGFAAGRKPGLPDTGQMSAEQIIENLRAVETNLRMNRWREHLGDDPLDGFGGRGPAEYHYMATHEPEGPGLTRFGNLQLGEEAPVDPALYRQCEDSGHPPISRDQGCNCGFRPAPPRGEGDDLAARTVQIIRNRAKIAREQGTTEAQIIRARALDEAANEFADILPALRASTHPEQSARVDPEQLRLVRNMAKIEASQSDPEQAPAFTDKRRASHRRRADALNAVLAALEPASPTPTEQENDR